MPYRHFPSKAELFAEVFRTVSQGEVERLVFRRAHAAHFAAILRDGIARGELPEQDAEVVGAALVGALGEALVGPLSPVAPRADPDALTATLVAFCLRSVTDQDRHDVHARP